MAVKTKQRSKPKSHIRFYPQRLLIGFGVISFFLIVFQFLPSFSVTAVTVNSPGTITVDQTNRARTIISGYSLSGLDSSTRALVTIRLQGATSTASGPTGAVLSLPTTTGLTASYGYTSGTNTFSSFTQISFTGTQANVNTALSSLTYISAGNSGTANIFISATENVAGVAFFAQNNHFYKVGHFAATAGSGSDANNFCAPSGTTATNYINDYNTNNGITLTRINTGDSRCTWGEANRLARGSSLKNQTGYLTNITSQAENDFLKDNLSGALNTWIGGTDGMCDGRTSNLGTLDNFNLQTSTSSATACASPNPAGAGTEGVWRFYDGPEKDTVFWRDGSPGSGTSGYAPDTSQYQISGQFSNWATYEPNNSSSSFTFTDSQGTTRSNQVQGEDNIVFNWGATDGKWNDLHESEPTVAYYGYIVEYGTSASDGGFSNEVSSSTKSINFGLPSISWTTPAVSLPSAGTSNDCTKTDSTDGNYRITTITSGSTCTWITPDGVSSMEALIVGGGGGGGSNRGGGGGAGGYLKATYGNLSTALRITVGAGGTGSDFDNSSSTTQTSGGNSIVVNDTTISTAAGGGYGGGRSGSTNGDGANGGSGGGAGFNYNTNSWSGGSASIGQGNSGAGSAGSTNTVRNTGGGGGAGSAGVSGANGSNTASGGTTPDGGRGLGSLISGTFTVYAGGGGGAVGLGNTESGGIYSSAAAGFGGIGGGGNGGGYNQAGSNGTANTGGGGGGGAANTNTDGGNGGSGVVILRYSLAVRFNAGSYTPAANIDSNTVSNNGTLVAQSTTYTASSDSCGLTWTDLSSAASYNLEITKCYRFTYDSSLATGAVAPTSGNGIAVSTNLTSPVLKPNYPTLTWTTPAVSTPSAGTSTCTKTDSTINNYRLTTITAGSNCSWTTPSGVSGIEALIVGGGGGGGTNRGGGGGAGGFVNYHLSPIASSLTLSIGSGGTGAIESPRAYTNMDGGNTVLISGTTTMTANGGGGGGSHNTDDNPNSGGSGGGASFALNQSGASATKVSLNLNGTTSTIGFGNSGGSSGTSDPNRASAGGGGAGSSGVTGVGGSNTGTGGTAPSGGVGKVSTITGSAIFYAAGGGGSIALGNGELGGSYLSTAPGPGGFGGGGAGASYNSSGTNAIVNTGSGGGGSSGVASVNGGNGATGVIILKYSSDVRVDAGTSYTPNALLNGSSANGTLRVQTATYTISTDSCGDFGNTSSTTTVSIESDKCYRWTYDSTIASGAVAPSNTNSVSADSNLTSPIVKPITFPSAPLSVAASISGSTTTVTWNTPLTDGGASISSYEIQYAIDGGSWTSISDTDGNNSNTSATFEDLDNGSLTFRVRAVNRVGAGSYSSTSSSITNFGGVNSSCTGIGTLQNGDFETLPSTISEENTTSRNVGKWHGWANSTNKAYPPRQFLVLYESSHTSTPNLSNWETTATDHLIEIQRQVSGYEQTGDISQSTTNYYDRYNPTSGSGTYWAELNADEISALYQDVATIPNTTLRWSLLYRGRRLTVDDSMQVKIGSTSSVTAQTVSSRFSPTNNVYSAPTFSNTADASYTSTNSISGRLNNGWRKYEGNYVVPAGQTTTRFQFEATSGSSLGNYIDAISFTPHIACPFSKTIIKNKTYSIDVFESSNLSDSEKSKGLASAYIASTPTQTGLSGTISFTSSSRSFSYDSPNSTGTSTIKFKITNSFGDTSSAYATLNVVDDLTQVAPTVIPIDPRATFVDLPGIDVVGNANLNAIVCYRQVESNGSEMASGHSLSFEVKSIGSAIVPQNSTTSELSIGGTQATVESASQSVRVTNSGGGRLLNSIASKYIRIRTSGDDDLSAGSCSNGTGANQSDVIELRPVALETNRRLSVNVD